MGTIRKPEPVKLIAGLLAPSAGLLARAQERLAASYGAIDVWSAQVPFTFTMYYQHEMGKDLLRQWVAFATLIDPGQLAAIKTATNDLEDGFREPGGRRVNIDPGYLTQANLILASTKDFSHRIYLSGGIYGEVTLIYKGKSFTPLPWTYPDYQSVPALAFLEEARDAYRRQLKELPARPRP
jgi:hypothetical protein